uniref:Retrovirus-related Pol polyprotein from transposon TNT 1-94-like beta-barrel domain-containing protein n=1 Tax=Lactuca sativa TaxID=4236 RepID=A0A9R1WXJ2_LACSA|nr:hypothetical protein LSAT_V11C800429800 [Lactuca sativa]
MTSSAPERFRRSWLWGVTVSTKVLRTKIKVIFTKVKGNGKKFQSNEYSQEQVQQNYENYLNESMSVSTSSQESLLKPSKWKEVKRNKKVDFSASKAKKVKIKVDASILNDFICVPKTDEVSLIEKIKTKVCCWIFNLTLYITFLFERLQVLCDDQYEENWYIDSGFSRHMTRRKENLRDLRKLENDGVVKFGNNQKCKVKGYGKVTNGKFIVNRVTYLEGLKHNLISIYLNLVLELGIKFSFIKKEV